MQIEKPKYVYFFTSLIILLCSSCTNIIKSIEFMPAKNSRDIKKLEVFCENYPSSKECEEAKYIIAKKIDTVDSLTKYIKICTVQEYCLSSIDRRDEIYFENASNKNTIEGYQKYLFLSPQGKFLEEAEWRIALLADDLEKVKTFIEKYPDSEHRSHAEFRILYLKTIMCKQIEYVFEFLNSTKQEQLTEIDYKKLLLCLEDISEREGSPSGFIRLYEETKNKNYLIEAIKFKNKVSEISNEKILVSTFPDEYFKIKNWKIDSHEERQDSEKGKVYAKYTYNGDIFSIAKLKTYNIEVNLSLPLAYTSYKGLIFKNPKTLRKMIKSKLNLRMFPNTREKIRVEFGPYVRKEKNKKSSGSKKIVWDIVAKPKYTIKILE